MSSEQGTQRIVIHLYNAPREHNMSPEETMDRIYTNKKYKTWYSQDLSFLKKTNPSISKNSLECLAVEVTISEILGLQEYHRVIKSLKNCQPKLSKIEAQTLHILIELLKNKPEYLMSYVYDHGIFPGILFKEVETFKPNILDLLNDTFKQNPHWSIELTLASLSKSKQYPDTLHSKLDHWLSNHLKKTNLRKMAKDDDFVEKLVCYLKYNSCNAHEVYPIIYSQIDAFSEGAQHVLWDQILAQNTNKQRCQNAILSFLEEPHSDVANKVFYSQVCSNVSPKAIEELLGIASDKAKRNYFRLLHKQGQDLTNIQVQYPGMCQKKFLAWELHSNGKISNDEMMELVQKCDLQQRAHPAKNSFLFQKKDLLNWDIFKAGCQKMKSSPMNVLMWISSFKKLPGFGTCLASKWETLPPEVRKNKNIQLAMDNHFNLLYSLACFGNTSMLNEIKQTMMDDYPDFIRRLMRGRNRINDNALHVLCRQHKKGVLKLLEKLPEAEQKELLHQKNALGQTALDVCSSDFRRFLEQKNFARPVDAVTSKSKMNVIAEPVRLKPIQSASTARITPKFIWRSQFKTTRFLADLEKFKNQPNVIKAMNRKIAQLRSMSWPDLQLRMGQDIKRSFKSRLCAADFSADGNAYRMGYILQDGVIATLFIMTHQQYNTELNLKGPLDAMTLNVRKQISVQTALHKQGGR